MTRKTELNMIPSLIWSMTELITFDPSFALEMKVTSNVIEIFLPITLLQDKAKQIETVIR